MTMDYDPTGKEYTFFETVYNNNKIELKISKMAMLDFLYVSYYENDIRLFNVTMNCQKGLITQELWVSFKNTLIKRLATVGLPMPNEPDEPNTLIEKIWHLIQQITMDIKDGVITPEFPEYDIVD